MKTSTANISKKKFAVPNDVACAKKNGVDDLHADYNHTFTRWNDEVATCRENVVTLIHSVITSILRDDPAGEADRCLEAPELAKRSNT